MKYWAFISYSGHDESWAKWIHKEIESYIIPRGLSPSGSVELPRSRRLRPIFLDRDELRSGPSLNHQLIAALADSRFLIVVCSPHSARAGYVNQEICEFLKVGDRERILCGVVDGEPNVSPTHSPIETEAFAPQLRFEVLDSGEFGTKLADVPLAADFRPNKDGKARGFLKLIAGMLGVGLDDLIQRERTRHRRKLLTRIAAVVGAIVVGSLTYVAMADRDYPIPGGSAVRTVLDRNALSWFRPIPERQQILDAAKLHRIELGEALIRNHSPKRLFSGQLGAGAGIPETWTSAQILASLARSPELTAANTSILMETFALMFSEENLLKFDDLPAGWVHKSIDRPQGEITAWMLTALGQTIARTDIRPADRQLLRNYAAQALGFLERHRGAGGWAMYPSTKNVEYQNFYTSVLVLQALLHLSEIDVYVANDPIAHRADIQSTAQWLIDGFDASVDPPGWKRFPGDPGAESFDGLRFLIYSQLLRAEVSAGITIPKALSDRMTEALISCTSRDLAYTRATAEFWTTVETGRKKTDLQEGITFLWYPWAIESSAWWLARASQKGATPLEINRVTRTLGHLVNGLGADAVRE